jgi:hypothetical protein
MIHSAILPCQNFYTAVQMLTVVICIKDVFNAVDSEFAVRDTIAEPADNAAEIMDYCKGSR